MVYDLKAPPALITQGIGGPAGSRFWAFYGDDPVTTVVEPGYISNAKKLGMRDGDVMIYTDQDGGLDYLVIDNINANGSADVLFQQLPLYTAPSTDLTPVSSILDTIVIPVKRSGETDWTLGFQRAANGLRARGGGIMRLAMRSDGGEYLTSAPTIVYSNIKIVADFGVTVRNTAATNSGALFWAASCFYVGTFFGFTSDNSLFELPSVTATGALAEGATSVTIPDASTFAVGGVICLESIERRDTSYPNYACLNTIIAKSGDTLFFKYPLKAAMGSGGNPRVYLVPTDPDDSPMDCVNPHYSGKCFLARNSGIFGLDFSPSDALSAERYSQALHVACYESVFEDCNIEGGVAAVAGNPFSRSTFRNTRIIAQDSPVELAYLTTDSRMEYCDVIAVNPVMDVDAGGFTYAARMGSEGGSDNISIGSRFHYACTGPGALLSQPAVSLVGPRSEIIGGSVNGGLKPSALAVRDRGKADAVSVFGGAGSAISIAGRVSVTDNVIEGSGRTVGSISAISADKNSVIKGNTLGDGTTADHIVKVTSVNGIDFDISGNSGCVRNDEDIFQATLATTASADTTIMEVLYDAIHVDATSRIEITAQGSVGSGQTAGAKGVSLYVLGTTIGPITVPDADYGDFTVEAVVENLSVTAKVARLFLRMQLNTGGVVTKQVIDIISQANAAEDNAIRVIHNNASTGVANYQRRMSKISGKGIAV